MNFFAKLYIIIKNLLKSMIFLCLKALVIVIRVSTWHRSNRLLSVHRTLLPTSSLFPYDVELVNQRLCCKMANVQSTSQTLFLLYLNITTASDRLPKTLKMLPWKWQCFSIELSYDDAPKLHILPTPVGLAYCFRLISPSLVRVPNSLINSSWGFKIGWTNG